jgi:3-mercaptopyruvate sulfurtransferase SseA
MTTIVTALTCVAALAIPLGALDQQSRLGGLRMDEWTLRELATNAPRPEYPSASLDAKVEGVVVAAVGFGADGRPLIIDILESPDAHTADSVRGAFKRGHWPGAVNIPFDELAVRAGPELPRDRRIVIDCTQEDIWLCRLGGGRLVEQKFPNVLVLVR